MSHRTFQIETLGCKSNRYDSQRLAEALEALGLRRAPPGTAPNVWIVNTCTVTGASDRKCRQCVRRAVREYPGAAVFVTGCYAASDAEALRDIEGVAGVFTRAEWGGMLAAIAGAASAERAQAPGDFGISGFGDRTRAFLKIQDGCDSFCAYCIVPHTRGLPRSRPLADALDEARRLIDGGFGEIVLTGIHLGIYGRDLADGVELADAVAQVAALPGLGRLRISSLEGPEASDRLLAAMQHPAVCAHLHLPLQSGDDRVLARMGRQCTAAGFLRVVSGARAKLDNPAITGDVIVGFPGEDEEAFQNTLRACREARFSRLHIFPFSPRPGTRAAQMDGRVPPDVVKGRRAGLEDAARTMAAEWAAGLVGQCARVLFEERDDDGRLTGYTDRYVRLTAHGPQHCVGRLHTVRCTRAPGASLEGEIVEPLEG